MSDLYLDRDTWDVVIENGDLRMVENPQDETVQEVLITVKTNRGEWFRDITYGIPYFENENSDVAIMGKAPKSIFDSYIRGGILYNEGVESIIDYSSVLYPRSGKITVNASVEVPTGETITIQSEIN